MNLFAKTLLTAAIPFLVLSPREITITRNEVGPEDYPYAIAVGQIDASGAVKSVVEDILDREGVDFTKASKVIFCESTWNEKAVGDHGNSLGLWQIRLKSHPNVTRACALDARCSTEYAVKLIQSERSWRYWTCGNK